VIYPSINLPIHPSIDLPIYLFIYLSVCLSVCLSIYLSIYSLVFNWSTSYRFSFAASCRFTASLIVNFLSFIILSTSFSHSTSGRLRRRLPSGDQVIIRLDHLLSSMGTTCPYQVNTLSHSFQNSLVPHSFYNYFMSYF